MKQRIVLVFIGPQGSGKGTQAAILADSYGFKVIVMGDLLRREAEKNTPRGQEIQAIITRGDFVSDNLIIRLLHETIAGTKPDTNILFDGFPRTIEQAREIDKEIVVTRVVHIDLPYEVSVKRISGRIICEHGHNYNTYYLPPRKEGICNVDKTPLHKRADDTEEAVEHRLALYEKETAGVVEYYRKQGKLINVNGNASVFEVAHEIKTKVLSDLL